MDSRILSTSFILFLCIATVTAEDNLSITAVESGIIRVDSVDMVIDQNGLVSVSEELTARVGDRVAMLIPGNVQGLSIFDSKGNAVVYESRPEGDKELIVFVIEEPGGVVEEKVILSYSSQHLTAKFGDTWGIRFSVTATPGHTILKITFPGDTRIISMEPEGLYWTPIRDSGLWVYPQARDFHFRFEYKVGVSGPIIPKSTTSSTSTTLPSQAAGGYPILPIAFIILVSVAAFFILRRRGGVEPVEEVKEESGKERRVKESIRGMLDENERRVVEILEGSDEEITQAYVYKSTGIPKSSLSEVIKRLEKRNIIGRTKEGRVNWIKLKEWVFE